MVGKIFAHLKAAKKFERISRIIVKTHREHIELSSAERKIKKTKCFEHGAPALNKKQIDNCQQLAYALNMSITKTTVNAAIKLSDAICLVNAYHSADCCIFKTMRAKKHAFKVLRSNKIDPNSNEEVINAYSDLVEETAGNILSDEWETSFDYWGGKCYAPIGKQETKGKTIMAGENFSYLCCVSLKAIEEQFKEGAE